MKKAQVLSYEAHKRQVFMLCNGTVVWIEGRSCQSPNSKLECGLYDALQLNCETSPNESS